MATHLKTQSTLREVESKNSGTHLTQSSAPVPESGARYEVAQANRQGPLTNKMIQEALNYALPNSTPLAVDGKLGKDTFARVKEFQMQYGIYPAGPINAETRTKLADFLERKQEEIDQYKLDPKEVKELQINLKKACELAAKREAEVGRYFSPALEVGRQQKVQAGVELVEKAKDLKVDGQLGPQTEKLLREFGTYIGAHVPTGDPVKSYLPKLVEAYGYEYDRLDKLGKI